MIRYLRRCRCFACKNNDFISIKLKMPIKAKHPRSWALGLDRATRRAPIFFDLLRLYPRENARANGAVAAWGSRASSTLLHPAPAVSARARVFFVTVIIAGGRSFPAAVCYAWSPNSIGQLIQLGLKFVTALLLSIDPASRAKSPAFAEVPAREPPRKTINRGAELGCSEEMINSEIRRNLIYS